MNQFLHYKTIFETKKEFQEKIKLVRMQISLPLVVILRTENIPVLDRLTSYSHDYCLQKKHAFVVRKKYTHILVNAFSMHSIMISRTLFVKIIAVTRINIERSLRFNYLNEMNAH